jgi:hypothetical protein
MLIRRELVEIDDRVPTGRGLGVIGDGGAPPDALGMARLLPEIEDAVVIDAAIGNAVGGVEHAQDGVEVRFVVRIGFENAARFRVLLRDPGERLGAVDVFQPEIGISRIGHFMISLGTFGGGPCARDAPHEQHGDGEATKPQRASPSFWAK